MTMPLKWEFPGGKIQEGETPEECLVREVREELNIDVEVTQALTPRTHIYDHLDLTVTLYPYVCTILSGKLTLHEHAASAWLQPADLRNLDWAEADRPILEEYQALRSGE